MSASTDEPFATTRNGDAGRRQPRAPARRRGKPRRIIDVTKETLVIMAEALEEIGDAYAIYGFSGHGRERVEVYRVKSFAEALNATVKGRLGGIEPKRSTRMGTALRHAVEKLAGVTSRCKHLFLLSDGFPQDYDYGQDRRSNVYGIRDTAAALREAEAAGVTPVLHHRRQGRPRLPAADVRREALHGDRRHHRPAARAAEDLPARRARLAAHAGVPLAYGARGQGGRAECQRRRSLSPRHSASGGGTAEGHPTVGAPRAAPGRKSGGP